MFLKCLTLAKLIDLEGNWKGGNTYVVQVGDTLDGKRPSTKIDKNFLDESGEVEIILNKYTQSLGDFNKGMKKTSMELLQ